MSRRGNESLTLYGEMEANTAAHPAGTVTTHGAFFFDQWYRDVAGVNISIPVSITLTNNGSGVYEFSTPAFFPLDGQGWNDSLCCGHNYSFTYELHTAFTYHPGQVFSFSGDDDVFVYINGQKVIDLGGLHGTEFGFVNLDLLGLIAGNNYNLDFFFAERHVSGSNFSMSTSIQDIKTVSTPEPGALALMASGITGLAAFRRRFRA